MHYFRVAEFCYIEIFFMTSTPSPIHLEIIWLPTYLPTHQPTYLPALIANKYCQIDRKSEICRAHNLWHSVSPSFYISLPHPISFISFFASLSLTIFIFPSLFLFISNISCRSLFHSLIIFLSVSLSLQSVLLLSLSLSLYHYLPLSFIATISFLLTLDYLFLCISEMPCLSLSHYLYFSLSASFSNTSLFISFSNTSLFISFSYYHHLSLISVSLSFIKMLIQCTLNTNSILPNHKLRFSFTLHPTYHVSNAHSHAITTHGLTETLD